MDVVAHRQKTEVDHSNMNTRTSISIHHIPSSVDLEGQGDQSQGNDVPNSRGNVPNNVGGEPNSDINAIGDTQGSDFYKSLDEESKNPTNESSTLLENDAQRVDLQRSTSDRKPGLVVPQISVTMSEDENGHVNGKLTQMDETDCPEVEVESGKQKSGCWGSFKQMSLVQLCRFDHVSLIKKNTTVK